MSFHDPDRRTLQLMAARQIRDNYSDGATTDEKALSMAVGVLANENYTAELRRCISQRTEHQQ
jgi:hypothetical protein